MRAEPAGRVNNYFAGLFHDLPEALTKDIVSPVKKAATGMDVLIQSWDTAGTKSTTSDYVVGQVWGRRGADFYLLDQERRKMDFDDIVEAIKAMLKRWSDTSSIIIEAQPLGAALASHLQKQIPGIIPLHVKGSKESRAMNCVPVWQSRNVYIPKPDAYPWVRDYLRELFNFPNGAHDDQVDATTLALNQLRIQLYPTINAVAKPVEEEAVNRAHGYVIGWIPARLNHVFTLVVFDQDDDKVVRFVRAPVTDLEEEINFVRDISGLYNAVVRVIDGFDGALLLSAELGGVYIERIQFNKAKLVAAYENLSQLIRNGLVDIPAYRELVAELSVFRSEFTYDERPDYSLQIAGQSGLHALCLVTHDLHPRMWKPTVYVSFDPDQCNPRFRWPGGDLVF